MRFGHLPIVLLAIAAVGTVVYEPPARARPPSVDRAAHDLARICAGEAGIQTETADCAAIHAVLTSRSERMGVGYRTAARWYAGRHLDRSRSDRRRWVAWLRPDTARPMGWPSRLSWSAHRGRWRDLLTLARQIVAGTHKADCAPHHWGDRHGDLERARKAGWDRLDCGQTRNLFWRVPSFPTGPS